MMIGVIGDQKLNRVITFTTSSDKVLTFDGFEQSSSVRLGKHEVHMQKPKTEFLGPELDTISFVIRLDVAFGVNPIEEIRKLYQLQKEGEAVSLVIGNRSYGENLWTIKSLRQQYKQVDNRGNLLIAELNIELEEYV